MSFFFMHVCMVMILTNKQIIKLSSLHNKENEIMIWCVSMIGLGRKDNRWGIVLDYNYNFYKVSMLC